jgi:UDP-N-acetylmuramoyl-tripeptide--D-alanyl-D-alanine ligase
MKPLSIKDIANAVNGRIVREGSAFEITGVSTDTRTIQPGDLFVPLIGERFDGHDYMEQAAQRGAAVILTQKLDTALPNHVYIIYTDNTLSALQALAAWYLKSFGIPVAAVTGSTGKTTTKDMIYSVLSEKFSVLRTQGNFNNEIGLPLTLFQLEPHHQIAVLEMGMSGFGEIRRLASIAPPKAAVISNIGVSHIEKLGSRENILKAKLEILEGFQAGYTAILNDDNDLLHDTAQRMIRENMPYTVVRYGTGPEAEYRAEDIRLLGESGTEYTLAFQGEKYPIVLKVPGRHNVYNSLAAIAVGKAFGMDMEEISSGLLKFAGGKMRLNIFRPESNSDIKVIDDAYNASPDSVNAALKILQEMEGKRKIAILGDMLELGEYSEAAHRQVGEMAAEHGVDVLVTKGQDSAWIGEGAVHAGMPAQSVYHMQSNEEVIDWLKNSLSQGDRILVKGSRGMQMEQVVAYLKNGRVTE